MTAQLYKLTASRIKADVFDRDFPIGLYLSKVITLLGVPVQGLHEVAMLLLKPECQFGFAPCSWVRLLSHAGFQHSVGVQFQWTVDLANSLWRYEPLVEGHQSSDYIKLWATGPGYAAVFTRTKTQAEPATLTMTRLKGRSTHTLQKPGTIRKAIKQDLLLLTYVHTCDEPLDLVRELGVLLDQEVRILPSTECWQEQALQCTIAKGPILNSVSYHLLVDSITGHSSLCEELRERLECRELFDWKQHFKKPALGSLNPWQKLLIAAANSRSTTLHTREFPGIRKLYAEPYSDTTSPTAR